MCVCLLPSSGKLVVVQKTLLMVNITCLLLFLSLCLFLCLSLSSQTLAGLEFIQQSLKFDWNIRLFLMKKSNINTELARTVHIHTHTLEFRVRDEQQPSGR